MRLLGMTLAAFATIACSTMALAADKKSDIATGLFVSAASGKITIKQHKEEKSFDLAADVKVTAKGKEGKVDDLKAGDPLKLTMTDGKVSAIESFEAKPKK